MSEAVMLERHFAYTPERVFEAWTVAEIVCQWLGCGADMMWDIHEWDVQVGGKLRVSLDYDGTPFVVEGEFLVVEPPHTLRYRWGEENVDIAIAADRDGCVVTVRHEGIATDELGGILADGWTASLSQLEDALSSMRVTERL